MGRFIDILVDNLLKYAFHWPIAMFKSQFINRGKKNCEWIFEHIVRALPFGVRSMGEKEKNENVAGIKGSAYHSCMECNYLQPIVRRYTATNTIFRA